eukprot:gene19518-25415_t
MNKVNNHIILKDNCHFVYGGDVCDRGTGDIRLLLDLISLKRRYPQRVHFIMGNRDCNKLRLKFELHESTALKCYPKVYWIKDDPLSNKEAGRVDRNINNRSNRLKWILSNTMGAPVAYESRKIELNLIKSTFDPSIYPSNYIYSNTISDDEITQSFEDLIDTKLDSKEFSKADGQIDKIEYIAKQQSHYLSSGELIDLLEPTHWAAVGGYDHKQPGSRLLQYGMGYMPDKSINPSVIYANYLSHGQPVPPNVAVIKAMKSRGINKIVVGHQPHGDAPVVIDEGGLQVTCSYSNRPFSV